jgi:hypothetical protein
VDTVVASKTTAEKLKRKKPALLAGEGTQNEVNVVIWRKQTRGGNHLTTAAWNERSKGAQNRDQIRRFLRLRGGGLWFFFFWGILFYFWDFVFHNCRA